MDNKNLCNDLNEVHRIIKQQNELIQDRENQIHSLNAELEANIAYQAKQNEQAVLAQIKA